jgi:predicted DNA-binding transcriptional regulator YafY
VIGFDLASFWRGWCTDIEESQPHYPVTLLVAPDAIPWLRHSFAEEIEGLAIEASTTTSWAEMSLVFGSLEEARSRILAFGGAVEVLTPRPLRESVLDHAQQILGVYQSRQA